MASRFSDVGLQGFVEMVWTFLYFFLGQQGISVVGFVEVINLFCF